MKVDDATKGAVVRVVRSTGKTQYQNLVGSEGEITYQYRDLDTKVPMAVVAVLFNGVARVLADLPVADLELVRRT